MATATVEELTRLWEGRRAEDVERQMRREMERELARQMMRFPVTTTAMRDEDMWGGITERDSVRKEPLVDRPEPENIKRPDAAAADEYEAVAGDLGFAPPELLRQRIIEFMLDQGMPIFNNEKVDKFLKGIASKDGKYWVWRPLKSAEPTSQFHATHHGQTVSAGYDKAVPLDILKRAGALKKKFGEKVDFFVSDYAVKDPDPFIMLKAKGIEQPIIFGVWDEPNWGKPDGGDGRGK